MALLALGMILGFLSNILFVSLLLTYSIIYHPLVSGLRLVALGVISKSELWKTFIPFWNRKYFGILFFNWRPS
jgi:hypothetical protein